MKMQTAQRVLPYAPSEILAGLEWTGPASRYPGSGSDMHWHAWGDDDALYVIDSDGVNFDRPWNFAHVLRVTGTPPEHEIEYLTNVPELVRPDSWLKRRYPDGALAVGSRLYIAAYDYVYDHEETGRPLWLADAISRHGGIAGIMWSDDYGRTWNGAPDADTPYFLGPRFAGLAFVGFGPGYTGVPRGLDGYVYAISNDGSWESGDHVFLARMPRDRVLDRAAWEFRAGDGWTGDEEAAEPVVSDPGYVGHPTMTWNPGLGRFLLAFGSDSVPQPYDTPPEVAQATWHRRRELKVLEAPGPWGPFGLVHYDPAWEGEHVAYLPQIPQKWLAPDGLSGWMAYSGDYNKFVEAPSDYESFYGFMTRPFQLLPR